jgi:hypothetical protein
MPLLTRFATSLHCFPLNFKGSADTTRTGSFWHSWPPVSGRESAIRFSR